MPRYLFHTNLFTPTAKAHHFKCLTLEVEAADPESAWALVEPRIPKGSKLFCWTEDDLPLHCCVCKGVWHPATGDYESPTMRTCGPCTRQWLAILKGHLKRKWAKVNFYDHAYAPTGDTSKADLGDDQ